VTVDNLGDQATTDDGGPVADAAIVAPSDASFPPGITSLGAARPGADPNGAIPLSEPQSHFRRSRRWLVVAVIVAVIAGGAVVATVVSRNHGGTAAASNGIDNTYPTSTTTVTERSLSSQTQVGATLGYAGSYSAVNQAQGTFTALPAVGQVVPQGQTLYSVDATPVVLLYGSVPAYRTLSSGMTGADVEELNRDLVALGDATAAELSPTSTTFGAATATALKKLQAALGVTQTGTLTLGQAVFVPAALRVTSIAASLGGPAQPGQAAMQGTSTTRQVTIALDAAQESEVKVGDQVSIALPDNQNVPGVVSSVGTVATTSSGSGPGSGGGSATITVDVTPNDPSATGDLDQAPVEVSITTNTVPDALVVPVNALLALASGGYALEVVDPSGTHHLVPVTEGLFDNADGLVQVEGPGVAGQRIVIPAP
jgi:hypothetical protein